MAGWPILYHAGSPAEAAPTRCGFRRVGPSDVAVLSLESVASRTPNKPLGVNVRDPHPCKKRKSGAASDLESDRRWASVPLPFRLKAVSVEAMNLRATICRRF